MDTLPPEEAVRMFYAGHALAFASSPDDPFVAGQWMGQLCLCEPIPFDDALTFFTENPVIMSPRTPTEPPVEPPVTPPAEAPIIIDAPLAKGPDGSSSEAHAADLLEVNSGNWQNEPGSYTYQWKQRDDDTTFAIAGATFPTYRATVGDVDKSVFCTVRATNAVGFGVADSNDVAITPRFDDQQLPEQMPKRSK